MSTYLLVTLLVGLGPMGQAPAAPVASPSPAAAQATPGFAAYVVGPGDVLEVTVIDDADSSRTTTVQPDGTFTMPLLGEVPVAGKTISEIQRLITQRLARDFLVDPRVEVRVREYASQFALVMGEVLSPGRRPLRGNTRLIDLLIESGGFRPNASGEVLVQRTEGTFPNGEKSMRFRLGNTEMTEADRLNSELVLRNGDVITAGPKNYVFVDGEVGRPGKVAIENKLTVLSVIAESGGLGKFASSTVRIIRRKTADANLKGFEPCGGATEDVCREVDIKSIRRGKVEDVVLAPDDKIVVSRRRF